MAKKAKKKAAAKKAAKAVPPPRVARPPGSRGRPIVAETVRLFGRSPSVKHELPEKEAPPGSAREMQVITRENFLKGLRQQAKIAYTTDAQSRGIRWWWTTYYSADVSESAFNRWSSEDHWEEGRRAFWQAVESKVATQIADANANQFIADLKGLDTMFNTMVDQINGGAANMVVIGKDDKDQPIKATAVPVAFDKRGDAIRALTALDKRRDEKRKGVMGALPATGMGGSGGLPSDEVEMPQLTSKVARAMARARLLTEREEFGLGVAAVAADDEDDEESE